jgi:microcystin-dependent protein
MNANFQALVDAVNALNSASVPPGTVIAFAGASLPAGWLVCDGSAVSRTQYANLFSAIAVAHGGGDGVNTFNLPDLRGRFVRGVDGNAGHDPDNASRLAPQAGNSAGTGNAGDVVGSVQDGAFASHTHGYGVFGITQSTTGNDYAISGGALQYFTTGTSQTGAAGGSETRPVNVYMQYIIKT